MDLPDIRTTAERERDNLRERIQSRIDHWELLARRPGRDARTKRLLLDCADALRDELREWGETQH